METSTRKKSALWSTGLAIFAMFFGAGNIVFPLALGQFAQDKNIYSIVGLILTAVCVPLLGLLAMMLYKGNYLSFFQRIGKIPGFVVAVLILGLIGPFGGIPRCITISFSTLHACAADSMNWLSLPLFSALSCLVIFVFTYRPRQILVLLGYVLTPILLLCLSVIAVKGLCVMPAIEPSTHTSWSVFAKGMLEGYNTMDLLASFFFASVVLNSLQKNSDQQDNKVIKMACLGSLIAAVLLAAVYMSFSFLAAGFSKELSLVASHEYLGALAYQLLGPYAGMIASVAVCFACLTTEIALTAVFADFLQKSLFRQKISYPFALLLTLAASFLISCLRFEGISSFLVPILRVCYPALIVLCILNIINKLYDIKPTKRIFYVAMGVSLVAYIV